MGGCNIPGHLHLPRVRWQSARQQSCLVAVVHVRTRALVKTQEPVLKDNSSPAHVLLLVLLLLLLLLHQLVHELVHQGGERAHWPKMYPH